MQTEVYTSAATAMPGGEDFMSQIERSIRLLGGQHFLRISLFRLEFVGIGADGIGRETRQALSNFGMIGVLPDGSLGLLYLGPRPRGADDLAAERAVVERLNHELMRAAPSDARLLSVTAVHRWADEIDSAAELIDEAVLPAISHMWAVRKAS